MSQHYTDKNREFDPYSLPDVEVFSADIAEIECDHCGTFTGIKPYCEAGATCPSCERGNVDVTPLHKVGWFYWACFPGCMPDSDPHGPFDSEEEAIADMREQWDDSEEEEA